jgi:hypothetical protein
MHQVPARRVLGNWFLVYVGNFCGCLVVAYFFGYLTKLFDDEPFLSYVQSVAYAKTRTHSWWNLFLRAIPANTLVCMAVVLGIAAKGSAGKVLCLWFPVVLFVLSGFEHSVANSTSPLPLLSYLHANRSPGTPAILSVFRKHWPHVRCRHHNRLDVLQPIRRHPWELHRWCPRHGRLHSSHEPLAIASPLGERPQHWDSFGT